ncbi:MAG TPA: 50S ribosomal protein L3 N(5)-glutamine methyltransferase [Usitatibacteraceae bacterium]|nr:50S ribosomal protein L3 N(5)-glutamine methyltransferase [Usitatibacteraceae bacterium]
MRNTLGEIVEATEGRFVSEGLSFGHGLPEAFDEAAYLALHALGLPPDALDANWARRLSPTEQAAIEQLVARRIAERTPAAYLTREAWLGEHRFHVDERVIVPRSFIAELLHESLAPWVVDPGAVHSVLDLCTGSGCLAVLAALAFPASQVDAADLSPDALDVARINVGRFALDERIRLIQSDLFEALGTRRYDLIVTNPPYVTARSMQDLPPEYRREPEMALASGEDGLAHIRRILASARSHLNPGGLLVVEAGFNREGVEAAFPDLPMTWLEVSAGDDIVFLLEEADLARQPAANR